MALLGNEIVCEEVIYNKGDDFFVVFEALSESEEPFDLESIQLQWDISDSTGVLVEISGSDITIEDNYIQFRKGASFFDGFIFMGEYTHRLYEVLTNTTSFEGKFTLA